VQGILNPSVRRDAEFRGYFTDAELRDAHSYFAVHHELVPTPLHLLPARAATLGLRLVSVKDEGHRHGVNAFKIMGVRYAVHRLGDQAASRGLVCATTGNHGRAVARVARAKGVPCTVFVPAPRGSVLPAAEQRTRDARIAAMRADAATVVLVEGAYEDAVRRASDHAATTGATILSDTSWPGYDEIPRWIMAGYTQIFEEAYNQWDRPPEVMLIQGGVGGLVCAAVTWAVWRFGAARPRIVSCEPERAACLLESAAAGVPVTLTHELDTVMAGLRCAEVSPAAWPSIRDGVDAFVSVADDLVLETMALLAGPSGDDPVIQAGPSGACGVAAVTALARAPELRHLRAELGVDETTHAFAVVTEGP
jgi:diaminopropionate ammonia-lyase